MSNGEIQNEIVKPETEVYLCYQRDPNQYVSIMSSEVRYWYPTVGPTRIKLILSFRGQELKEEMEVKIITTERATGDKNVLGAFSDANECYYWSDTQGDKQLWVVTPETRNPDRKIRYGQPVLFTNKSWTQQLIPKEGTKWLTTTEASFAYWTIERA